MTHLTPDPQAEASTAGPPSQPEPDPIQAKQTLARRTWFDWREAAVTFTAIVLAFLVGAVLMVISDPVIMNKWSYFFARPADALTASAEKISNAYGALINGALGGWIPITESTSRAAPLILAGLGVGLAFRASLFNIGAQGQAVWGAIAAAFVGFHFHLPPGIHLILAIGCGAIAGALWGGIAGVWKARFGAHEVIVTIMLNYIAMGMLAWLLMQPVFHRPGQNNPMAPVVDWNAVLPRFEGSRLHLGFFLALTAAALVWWLLERSTTGFKIRAVGANSNAARTAGMSVSRTTIVTMVCSGALAGMAGVLIALGPTANGFPVPLTGGIVGNVGFDAITVALLGRSKPLTIVAAGLLFGAMNSGGLAMQAIAQTPYELTTVLQAVIVMFVAAPMLVKTIVPFLKERTSKEVAA